MTYVFWHNVYIYSKTGLHAGACVLLELKLKTDLLSLPCRHHVHKPIVGESSILWQQNQADLQLNLWNLAARLIKMAIGMTWLNIWLSHCWGHSEMTWSVLCKVSWRIFMCMRWLQRAFGTSFDIFRHPCWWTTHHCSRSFPHNAVDGEVDILFENLPLPFSFSSDCV